MLRWIVIAAPANGVHLKSTLLVPSAGRGRSRTALGWSARYSKQNRGKNHQATGIRGLRRSPSAALDRDCCASKWGAFEKYLILCRLWAVAVQARLLAGPRAFQNKIELKTLKQPESAA